MVNVTVRNQTEGLRCSISLILCIYDAFKESHECLHKIYCRAMEALVFCKYT